MFSKDSMMAPIFVRRSSYNPEMLLQGEPFIDHMCIFIQAAKDPEPFPQGFLKVQQPMSGGSSADKAMLIYHARPPMGIADVPYDSITLNRYPAQDHSNCVLPVTDLPQFAFPHGLRLQCAPAHKFPEPDSFIFLCTDVAGNHLYAAGLRFYNRLSQTDVAELVLGLHGEEVGLTASSLEVFCPTVLIVLSKVPLYRAMQEYLRQLHGLHQAGKWPVEAFIASVVAKIPLPNPGSFPYRLVLDTAVTDAPSCPVISLELPPPDFFPALDLPFSGPLCSLSVEHFIAVLALLLQEAKVVFICRSDAVISETMEVFRCLLFPLEWPYVYIPRLPDSHCTVLEAPGGSMIGLHVTKDDFDSESPFVSDGARRAVGHKYARQRQWTRSLQPGTYVVDLTENDILLCSGSDRFLQPAKVNRLLKCLPYGPRERLRSKLKDLIEVHSLGPDVVPPVGRECVPFPDLELRDACMVFMCDLLWDYPAFVRDPASRPLGGFHSLEAEFRISDFLHSAPSPLRSFLTAFTKTQMFSVLIQSRTEGSSHSIAFFERASALLRYRGLSAHVSESILSQVPIPKVLSPVCDMLTRKSDGWQDDGIGRVESGDMGTRVLHGPLVSNIPETGERQGGAHWSSFELSQVVETLPADGLWTKQIAEREAYLSLTTQSVMMMPRLSTERGFEHWLSHLQRPPVSAKKDSLDDRISVPHLHMEVVSVSLLLLAARVMVGSCPCEDVLQALGVLAVASAQGLVRCVQRSVWRSLIVACLHRGSSGDFMGCVAQLLLKICTSSTDGFLPIDTLTRSIFSHIYDVETAQTESYSVAAGFGPLQKAGFEWMMTRMATAAVSGSPEIPSLYAHRKPKSGSGGGSGNESPPSPPADIRLDYRLAGEDCHSSRWKSVSAIPSAGISDAIMKKLCPSDKAGVWSATAGAESHSMLGRFIRRLSFSQPSSASSKPFELLSPNEYSGDVIMKVLDVVSGDAGNKSNGFTYKVMMHSKLSQTSVLFRKAFHGGIGAAECADASECRLSVSDIRHESIAVEVFLSQTDGSSQTEGKLVGRVRIEKLAGVCQRSYDVWLRLRTHRSAESIGSIRTRILFVPAAGAVSSGSSDRETRAPTVSRDFSLSSMYSGSSARELVPKAKSAPSPDCSTEPAVGKSKNSRRPFTDALNSALSEFFDSPGSTSPKASESSPIIATATKGSSEAPGKEGFITNLLFSNAPVTSRKGIGGDAGLRVDTAAEVDVPASTVAADLGSPTATDIDLWAVSAAWSTVSLEDCDRDMVAVAESDLVPVTDTSSDVAKPDKVLGDCEAGRGESSACGAGYEGSQKDLLPFPEYLWTKDAFTTGTAATAVRRPGIIVGMHCLTPCECGHVLLDEELLVAFSLSNRLEKDGGLTDKTAAGIICSTCGANCPPRLHVRCYDTPATSTSGIDSTTELVEVRSFNVSYLSPFILRARLEAEMIKHGTVCGSANWLLEKRSDLYWNVVWFCRRLGLPTGLRVEEPGPAESGMDTTFRVLTAQVVTGWRATTVDARIRCLVAGLDFTAANFSFIAKYLFPQFDRDFLEGIFEDLDGSFSGLRQAIVSIHRCLKTQSLVDLRSANLARQIFVFLIMMVHVLESANEQFNSFCRGLTLERMYEETVLTYLTEGDLTMMDDDVSRLDLLTAMGTRRIVSDSGNRVLISDEDSDFYRLESILSVRKAFGFLL